MQSERFELHGKQAGAPEICPLAVNLHVLKYAKAMLKLSRAVVSRT